MFRIHRPNTVTGVMCGHTCPISGKVVQVNSRGVEVDAAPYDFHNPTPPYCARCMWRGRTYCAWCFGIIPLGEPVTLYTPLNPDFTLSINDQVEYTLKPRRLIGCMKCADDRSHAAGRWMLRRGEETALFVERVPTVFAGDSGTIAVSPVRLATCQTKRQIVAPIPLVGAELSWAGIAPYRLAERLKIEAV